MRCVQPLLMRRQVFRILFGLAICQQAHAQTFDEKNFFHYTTKNGLSNNYISGIEQDAAGYVWIGTSHGLNRFDGVSFKQFLHTAELNSLPDNAIYSMTMFQQNQLAVSTDDGVQIIDTRTLDKKNLHVPTEDALRYWSNACRYTCTDEDGNFGVSTKTGFYIFSASGQLKKRYDSYTTKDIGHSWMMFGNYLFELPDGNMLQQNSSGLFIYDRKKDIINSSLQNSVLDSLASIIKKRKSLFFFVSSYKILLMNSQKNSFDLFDIKNNKITSTAANLSLENETGWQTRPARIDANTWAINSKAKGFYLLRVDTSSNQITCYPQKYFSNYFCTSIFLDKRKRLWIGTDEGLFMQHFASSAVQNLIIQIPNYGNNFSITSVFVSGNLLIAGTDKNRILLINKPTGQLIKTIFLTGNKQEINAVTSFLSIHPDTLLAATTAGLYWINLKNYDSGKLMAEFFNSLRRPNALFEDHTGMVWIGTFDINAVYRYSFKQKKLESITKSNNPLFNINMPNSFAEDRNGNIWIAGDAIARWNCRSQKVDTLIEHLATQKNRKKGFTVMSDSKGCIWTSVTDDGFARISGNVPVHIRPDNLVPDYSTTVFPTLIEDRVFTASNNGIGLLNTKDLKAVTFDNDDGIPQQTPSSYNFSYDSLDRSAWVGCKNILCKLSFFENRNYLDPPALAISELAIINDSIINYPPESVRLKHFQNDIKLTISAINFTDPQNMRYAYRFVNGNDSSWVEMGTQQNILLTNISPGTYKLQIKVYAYDNKWPEQIKEISIRVQPPFWHTAWFFLSILLIFSAAVYFLYRNRIKQIKQRANLDSLLAQTEMKALHAQMNPHFIFNCLNSIREMILNHENMQASHYLSKFAQLIRLTLDNSTKPFISLQNTIDYLQRYLEMEKIRTENFSYCLEVDEELEPEEIFLPPMLIQPFIENAIWHGQTPDRPMKLFVRLLKKNNELICVVEDDGIGIQASLKNKEELNHNSVGIANIRQRIQLLNEKYNLKSTVLVEDKSALIPKNGTGTRVTLCLPVKNIQL